MNCLNPNWNKSLISVINKELLAMNHVHSWNKHLHICCSHMRLNPRRESNATLFQILGTHERQQFHGMFLSCVLATHQLVPLLLAPEVCCYHFPTATAKKPEARFAGGVKGKNHSKKNKALDHWQLLLQCIKAKRPVFVSWCRVPLPTQGTCCIYRTKETEHISPAGSAANATP